MMWQNRPKRRLINLSVAAVALFAACGTAPVKSYYTLENNKTENLSDNTPPLCALALGLNPVESAPPYDMSKIVFRPDALEVRFYTQSHWVSPPEEMFAKIVGRRIEAEHLFSAVDSSVNVSGPHLSLLIRIYAVEELDSGNDWEGRLAMSLFLRDEMADKLLWKYRFDIKEPAKNKEVKSVVAVLSKIYNQEMDKAVASMKKFLQNGGCHAEDESAEDHDDREYRRSNLRDKFKALKSHKETEDEESTEEVAESE